MSNPRTARRSLAAISVAGMLAAGAGPALANAGGPDSSGNSAPTRSATAPSGAEKRGAGKQECEPAKTVTVTVTEKGEPGERKAPTKSPSTAPAKTAPAKTGTATPPATGKTDTATGTGTATATGTVGTIVPDRSAEEFTDTAGSSSTYHLFTSKIADGKVKGVVVYLDGDGQNGVKNPESPYALGGDTGVVAEAGSRGFAVIAPLPPGGESTWYGNGEKNAAYVADLVKKVKGELNVTETWLLGFSGGAQGITKFYLPAHGDTLSGGGGVVITGGGGPAGGAEKSEAPKSIPVLFLTGDQDTGTGSENYDALADSKKGAAEYKAAGFAVTEEHPAGLTHDGLGSQFGTILGEWMDKNPSTATGAPGTPQAPSATTGTATTPGATGPTQDTPTAAPAGDRDAEEKSVIDNARSSFDALIAFFTRDDGKGEEAPKPAPAPTDIPSQDKPSGDVKDDPRNDRDDTASAGSGTTTDPTGKATPEVEADAPEETR